MKTFILIVNKVKSIMLQVGLEQELSNYKTGSNICLYEFFSLLSCLEFIFKVIFTCFDTLCTLRVGTRNSV